MPLTHSKNESQPDSIVFTQLNKIIESNIKAINATPLLSHDNPYKRGRTTKHETPTPSALKKIKQEYESIYKNVIDPQIFSAHHINNSKEKNALALAYASSADLIMTQLERMWPVHFEQRYIISLHALIQYSKAIWLDEGLHKLDYLEKIKNILDSIQNSSFSHLSLKEPIDPWLIKGIIALIKHYMHSALLHLAHSYAQCSLIRLGINVFSYDPEVNQFFMVNKLTEVPAKKISEKPTIDSLSNMLDLPSQLQASIENIWPQEHFEDTILCKFSLIIDAVLVNDLPPSILEDPIENPYLETPKELSESILKITPKK